MFPCIGQIVVARTDKPDHEKSPNCHICGKVLIGADQNSEKNVALCRTCDDRLMRSTPHLAQ